MFKKLIEMLPAFVTLHVFYDEKWKFVHCEVAKKGVYCFYLPTDVLLRARNHRVESAFRIFGHYYVYGVKMCFVMGGDAG